MSLKKWKLLSSKDVSPSPWFPIESRTYQLPNGRIVKDFTVTTIADAAMVIPILTSGKLVLVRQYKPGIDDIVLQFPAGRQELHHQSTVQTAQHELEEETGIQVAEQRLKLVSKLSAFPTKGTELVFIYLVDQCEYNSQPHLDENEEIELVELTPTELDEKILSGEIYDAQTIIGWLVARKKFPTLFP